MAKLSAAEKQRLYRQRRDADPIRRAEYQAKRKQGYADEILTKRRKSIAMMSERERSVQRKKWRENQARRRQRIKTVQAVLTPESSPETSPNITRQKQQGQRLRKSGAKKRRRQIQELKKELQKLTKQRNKYKKRYSRLTHDQITQLRSPNSPAARVEEILQGRSVISPVKRTLTFHFALITDLKAKYKALRQRKERRALASILSGTVIKKYKFQRQCRESFGFTDKIGKQLRKTSHASVRRATVRQFFCRDDVSRLTTGRKNTITVQKMKKQRRLLCDLLQNLHVKFVAEHGDVSYAFFCRHRPFWVVKPNEQDRQTCQCKTHENLQFMANALNKLDLLDTNNLETMTDKTVCQDKTPSDAKSCAYGVCEECKYTTYALTKLPSSQEVTFSQWCLKKSDSKQGEEPERKCTITVKEPVTATEVDLAAQFQDRLFKFRLHIFNIRWQYSAYRNLRENLTSKDCLMHIDFSENYSCKYGSEIQSVHFGGSHQQATLHTGVLYTHNQPPMSFATISPSRRHDPAAIWAHLDPVLGMLKRENPDVENIHFFSDGPATQYRQKGNFFMIASEPHQKGFRKTTWSFFEASHGKGAPDGVGGALKRSADALVRHGIDIPDAETLYQVLTESGTHVKLFFVSNEQVEERVRKMVDAPLSAIKGTMKIHQVISIIPGILQYRDISCFCQAADYKWDCPCYDLQETVIRTVQSEADHSQPTHRPDVIEVGHCGQWCVVCYDDQPYPGIILEVEEHNVRIKCMHRSSRYDLNKFHWPSPIDDINWYGDDQIMCLMPEPLSASRRIIQLDDNIWSYIRDQLNL